MKRLNAMGLTKFLLPAAACWALALVSCSPQPSPVPPGSNVLIFSVAASTAELAQAAAQEFAQRHDIKVTINPGPSNALANQIVAGAPADLFLSASREWGEEIVRAGLAEESTPLLANRLVIAVPRGNPAKVREPRDLLSERISKVALAGENVPAGKYADQALGKLELLASLNDGQKIVRGHDVRSALSYVEMGEAEAGIVYATDVPTDQGVETAYEFDPALHDEIVYMLVLLKQSEHPAEARQLYDYLQTSAAKALFKRYGFSPLTAEASSPLQPVGEGK